LAWHGNGVAGYRRDVQSSVKFWKKAAKAGEPAAMFWLGQRYYNGNVTNLSRDAEASLMWLSRFLSASGTHAWYANHGQVCHP
jgi:TPR repeat protein